MMEISLAELLERIVDVASTVMGGDRRAIGGAIRVGHRCDHDRQHFFR